LGLHVVVRGVAMLVVEVGLVWQWRCEVLTYVWLLALFTEVVAAKSLMCMVVTARAMVLEGG
jgi:hypothetical protein